MAQVFISYSRKDLSFVKKLAGDLQKAGLNVWYDISGLAGGSHWRTEIEKAIKESQYIVVVLSPDSVKSSWVEREFLFADDRKRTIIPILYRACEIPINYLNLNYVDVQGDKYCENFAELLEALGTKPPAGILPSAPPRSPSFSLRTGSIILFAVAAVGVLFAVWQWFSPKEAPTPTAIVITSPTSGLAVDTSQAAAFTATFTPATTFTPTATLIPSATSFPTEISPADPSGHPIRMRYVPEGEFTMGSNSGNPEEKPIHSVTLDAFYMDTYEVTNALYEACVNKGVCTLPHEVKSYTHLSYYGNSEFDNYPVVYVDWFQAGAYCEWRGAYLPTEAQWEKAARGTDARLYPWGEGISCNHASYKGCGRDIDPVGDHESGISPFGVHDMSGNVWEWVSDWYSETYYRNSPDANPLGPEAGTHRVLRGGTWDSDADNLYTFRRLKFRPNFFTEGIGFRCARDAAP